MGKKKGLGLGEVWTAVVRHFNNVVTDPSRQRVINLFLGIYCPMNNSVPIWNIVDDAELHSTETRVLKLPQI